MPTGIIINGLSVFLGGAIGVFAGRFLSDELKEKLTMVFGCCALGMGIVSVILMQNMPAVILAVILGTITGVVLKLGKCVNAGAAAMEKGIARLFKAQGTEDPARTEQLITIIVLFCASGTGIYGSLVSGMTGEHTILIAKSFLDFFTAMIFAAGLGWSAAFIAIPQMIIFLLLFYSAHIIYPLTTPAMIADFKACGGFLLLATSFRMLKLKQFPTVEMIPAMVLVFPLSALWTVIAGLL